MDNNNIVYIELNNWSAGEYYPEEEPFIFLFQNDINYLFLFRNEEWIKYNKICIVEEIIDMSNNFCITATREWVEKTFPSLLTKYTEFLRYPDEDGDVYSKIGNAKFKEYTEENFGYHEYCFDEDE